MTLSTGELNRERVELAAQLGHPVASALYPEAELMDWNDHGVREGAIAAAVRLLELFGQTFAARIAADWAEHALPAWETEHPGNMRPHKAIDAVRAWLHHPSREHRNAAHAANVILDNTAHAAGIASAAAAAAAVADNAVAAAAFASFHAAKAAETAASVGSVSYAAMKVARDAEYGWQQLRIAAYLLGED